MLDCSVVHTVNLIKRLTGMTYKNIFKGKAFYLPPMVGYENESCFRSRFKGKYKKNPLEYRKEKGL